MMQLMREKMQGMVTWTIIVLVVIGFASWGVGNYFANNGNPVLAVVNGRKITAQDVDDQYNRFININSSRKGFDPSQLNVALIKSEILKGLINQEAVVSGLQSQGYRISDDILLANIRSIPYFKENDTFSFAMYKNVLQQLQVDEAEFEQAQRDELMVQQVGLGIEQSGFMLPAQVEKLLEIIKQQRSFTYVTIPTKRFNGTVSVTEEEIKDYYNKHQHDFLIPAKVKLQYVQLSLDELLPQVKVTDQELKEYYEKNINNFSNPELFHIRHIMLVVPSDATDADKEAIKNKIDAIYKQVQSGEDFGLLASRESDDAPSAKKGGDIGWASKNDGLPEAVYALRKPNQFTEPVQSEHGWHIFQLIEAKSASTKSFAQVRASILERYKHEKVEALFSEKGAELANIIVEHPDSLSVASEKLHLPIKTTELVTKQGGNGITSMPLVMDAAFSDQVYVQGQNSELLRVGDDNYVVIRVIEKLPSRQEDLTEVSERISKILRAKAARYAAQQLGEKIVGEIKAGTSIAQVAQQNKLELHSVKNIERDDRNYNQALIQQVFGLPRPNKDLISVGGFALPSGDYSIAVVTDVKPGIIENKDDSSIVENGVKRFGALTGKLEYATLQAQLIKDAKIDIKVGKSS